MLGVIYTYTIPVIAFVLWKKKYSARLFPFVIGFFVYLSILIPRYMVRLMILTPELKQEHIWGYYLTNAIISALFEELMRYGVFKAVLKDSYSEWSDCVSYAIGHGFCEILLTYKVWGHGLSDSLFDGFMVFFGVAASIAMTSLVFKSVHYDEDKTCLIKALIMHVLLNADRALYFTGTMGAVAYMFVDLGLTIAACVYSYRTVRENL